MKIRDAQEMYRAQIRDYNSEMSAVSKRRKEIQNALKNASGADKDTLDKEAATIELTYKALQDKQNEYYDYVNQSVENMVRTGRIVQLQYTWHHPAMGEVRVRCTGVRRVNGNDGMICIVGYHRLVDNMDETRRLMKGDIVPSTDEKKLMEYNDKLYQMAKNMGEMAKVEKRKKHKSLWDDEEEKQYEDPDEVGANATAQGTAPQIKSAGEIMSSTGYNGAMDSEN